ncbi:hypothetical protein [Bacillus marinisedimentorum]|uniref:hypothetical protein n=1 Tax=Bacillus marinisedimentorum TaxID=1821260 RepID=UPI0008724B5A|nr:hypothetical protein [Bacillus marinisedimentorum]
MIHTSRSGHPTDLEETERQEEFHYPAGRKVPGEEIGERVTAEYGRCNMKNWIGWCDGDYSEHDRTGWR